MNLRCKLELLTDDKGPVIDSIELDSTAGDWQVAECKIKLSGTHPLYIRYTGKGNIDLLDISFK